MIFSSTASFSQQPPAQEKSPQYQQHSQQHHKGITVTVKTFENEEVGILTGNNLVILFNINQVELCHIVQ